jgi:hypothetical protein
VQSQFTRWIYQPKSATEFAQTIPTNNNVQAKPIDTSFPFARRLGREGSRDLSRNLFEDQETPGTHQLQISQVSRRFFPKRERHADSYCCPIAYRGAFFYHCIIMPN